MTSSRCGSPSGRSAAARRAQPAHRADVTARLGAARRRDEPLGRAPCEVVEPRIGAVELGPVAVGALEVVADDLVLLDERCVPVEPVGERLVELGSRLLGERVVGGVADQKVAEAECLLVGVGRLVRADHLLADEREEVGGDVVALGRRRELLHGAAVEDLPLDGTAADHVALAGPEPVEPRLQERLDRRRHRRSRRAPPSSLTVASISSMKSGLPSAAGRIRRAHVVGELRSAREPRDQQLAVLAGERLEQDRRRVQLAAAPAGPQLEQLGPGDAEQEDRRVARPVGDVLDQVEEDRLGPLDVVEHEDLRPLAARRLDQPAEGELRVGRASCRSRLPGSTPIASRISTSGQ